MTPGGAGRGRADRDGRGRPGRLGAPLAATLLLALVSCGRPVTPPPAPVPTLRLTIGEPYSLPGPAGPQWYYPREDYGLEETGLAAVLADTVAGRRTADGGIHDPAVLTAAHRTVQLPTILRVTNLENGRSLLVRADDRGPADPGRAVALSRRAAALLGVAADRPAQVRLAVEPDLSRALAASIGRAPGEAQPLMVATAPGGTVRQESLAPPPGARQAASLREGRGAVVAVATAAEIAAPPLARLPEDVTAGPIAPGRLLVQLGSFDGAEAARRQAARVPGAWTEPFGPGRRPQWRVRLGPFPDPAAADRALAQVLRAGVPEARILID